MARTLSDIMRSQAEFDRQHQGNVPFFEEISASNLAALEHLLVCVAGEVGELANVIKKIRRGDATYLERRDDVIEETVDVFIYVLKLANQVGFDLEVQYNAKMKMNRQRFLGFEK
jgi:NTP pyrophosphatase (non-canonical NTP hydrolase)